MDQHEGQHGRKCNIQCHGQNRAHVELERTHEIKRTDSNAATATRVWEASERGIQRVPGFASTIA